MCSQTWGALPKAGSSSKESVQCTRPHNLGLRGILSIVLREGTYFWCAPKTTGQKVTIVNAVVFSVLFAGFSNVY